MSYFSGGGGSSSRGSGSVPSGDTRKSARKPHNSESRVPKRQRLENEVHVLPLPATPPPRTRSRPIEPLRLDALDTPRTPTTPIKCMSKTEADLLNELYEWRMKCERLERENLNLRSEYLLNSSSTPTSVSDNRCSTMVSVATQTTADSVEHGLECDEAIPDIATSSVAHVDNENMEDDHQPQTDSLLTRLMRVSPLLTEIMQEKLDLHQALLAQKHRAYHHEQYIAVLKIALREQQSVALQSQEDVVFWRRQFEQMQDRQNASAEHSLLSCVSVIESQYVDGAKNVSVQFKESPRNRVSVEDMEAWWKHLQELQMKYNASHVSTVEAAKYALADQDSNLHMLYNDSQEQLTSCQTMLHRARQHMTMMTNAYTKRMLELQRSVSQLQQYQK